MIEKNIYKVTCDIKNCKNLASFFVAAKGRMGKFYICESCLREMDQSLRKVLTPKSPKNAIKKALEERNLGEN